MHILLTSFIRLTDFRGRLQILISSLPTYPPPLIENLFYPTYLPWPVEGCTCNHVALVDMNPTKHKLAIGTNQTVRKFDKVDMKCPQCCVK